MDTIWSIPKTFLASFSVPQRWALVKRRMPDTSVKMAAAALRQAVEPAKRKSPPDVVLWLRGRNMSFS
ncbi:MAG: hypothetical protein GTO63_01525 [Anaerolineae bacterium]|nr:hypothetical protein [Anaerolineae bacterium]NIN93731.1 hypothetical protein [Anaerolineae bacterium]NIQ76768.1 hypothetical protein [Anaerolineae bacterium]